MPCAFDGCRVTEPLTTLTIRVRLADPRTPGHYHDEDQTVMLCPTHAARVTTGAVPPDLSVGVRIAPR